MDFLEAFLSDRHQKRVRGKISFLVFLEKTQWRGEEGCPAHIMP